MVLKQTWDNKINKDNNFNKHCLHTVSVVFFSMTLCYKYKNRLGNKESSNTTYRFVN